MYEKIEVNTLVYIGMSQSKLNPIWKTKLTLENSGLNKAWKHFEDFFAQ